MIFKMYHLAIPLGDGPPIGIGAQWPGTALLIQAIDYDRWVVRLNDGTVQGLPDKFVGIEQTKYVRPALQF